MRHAFPHPRFFLFLLAVFGGFVASPAAASIDWTKVYGGYSSPTEVTHANDGSGRLFVVEQFGTIRIIRNGVALATPFIDLGASGLNVIAASDERGLLGLAFHPQYATNHQFYVDYTRKSDGATVIARYTASANADIADPVSGTILLTIPQPESNHNGGSLKFGPDGFLYIGMGDGGGGNDQHGTIGNAQDKFSLLGKMLRIDVDHGGSNPYAIPPGNPFATGVGGLKEIFTIGMRNPWRMSFDRSTGDLWIGDVGQNAVEEVDLLPAGTGAGANLGWRIIEGNSCTGLTAPPSLCTDPTLTPPILTYTHASGCSITGGYVYRGHAVPALTGQYLYADFCSGRIWAAQKIGTAPWRRANSLRQATTSARLARTRRENSTSPITRRATSTNLSTPATRRRYWPPVQRCWHLAT
jgi:glucose/arabinose dehydrogenase